MNRRHFVRAAGAGAAYAAAMVPAAGRAEPAAPEPSPGDETWLTYAVNVEMTWSRLPFLDRIRKVIHIYKEPHTHQTKSAPIRRLWHALLDVDKYLRGQSSWLTNYARRYRAGLRVGTSITEGTANFLVNRRMNKLQQMRWSRRGANLLLQVRCAVFIRCAVFNGTLGSGFGQLFQPYANQNERSANAA